MEKNVRCGKKRRTKEGEQREYEEKSVMRVETIGGGRGECSITVALSCCTEEAARRS